VHIVETRADVCESFFNRLFCLLNWTLTEFTVSAQVRDVSARLRQMHMLSVPAAIGMQ
jgi:hypothetical protein